MNTAMDDRTTIEWDKDDLDALGLLKIDVLALGMLTALAKGFRLLDKHYGLPLRLSTLPPEEACVYAMIQRADTIGVFQIESRAQMSMLPRLKPAKFYDLVIEVAIVRPGPIQGDMVHPYLRRRQGLEPVAFPSPELEAVLGKTLGVPLFQEQAMKIAIVARLHARPRPTSCGARWRRSAASARSRPFEDRMIAGMTAKGYEREFAERCFRQIEGFGEYGFPESHAASFALLVYASCWMKCRYPDVFLAAMLNAQPLGFYAPAQLVRDAREHGVEVREVDVNLSDWDCDAGGRRVAAGTPPRGEGCGSKGIHRRHAAMARATSARPTPCGSACGRSSARARRRCAGWSSGAARATIPCAISGCAAASRWRGWRSSPTPTPSARSASTGARRCGRSRRSNRVGDQDDLPLFAAARPERETEPDAKLPPMPLGAHVVEDYRRLSLSLKAHPVAFMRARLAARGILRSDALDKVKSGQRVTVAGLVLVRQRPGTAKGVIFMTLEDEAGDRQHHRLAEGVRDACARSCIGARFVAVTGKLQNEGGVIHLIAERMEDWTPTLGLLSDEGRAIETLSPADEVKRPQLPVSKKRQGNRFAQVQLFAEPSAGPEPAPVAPELKRALPAGRNFH